MHSNLARIACGALLLCIIVVSVSLLWQRQPRYEDHSLSYWLDGLQPTVISPAHDVRYWPNQKFRNTAAVTAWIARTTEMHERSAQVLRSAGPECLPVLFARLTAGQTPTRWLFLREWAYTLRLTDRGPVPGEDYSQVRRGQALTAILLLGKRAAPLASQLSVLTAEDKDDSVHRAASYALHNIAPDEFRRVRGPAKALQRAEPGGAADESQPFRSDSNKTSSTAGFRR